MNIPEGLHYRDRAELESKLRKFALAGVESLHGVLDFDRTLTTRQSDSQADVTSWIIMSEHLPPGGQAVFKAKYDQYRPKEIAGTMTDDDAIEWWSTVLDTFVQYELNINEIEDDFLHKTTVRPGIPELYSFFGEYDVPSVILSAGVREIILMWFQAQSLRPGLIMATTLDVDAAGVIRGWEKDSLIHTRNKSEFDHVELAATRSARPYAVVLGDSIHDADMAEASENTLKVRIVDFRPGELADFEQEKTKSFEHFDIVIGQESVEPLVTLLASIYSPSKS